MAFSFDDGTAGIYRVGYPDVITPYGGGVAALQYAPSSVAGVQFAGVLSGGSAEGRLVYLGFPFETIYPSAARDEAMARVLDFLVGASPTSGLNDFIVY